MGFMGLIIFLRPIMISLSTPIHDKVMTYERYGDELMTNPLLCMCSHSQLRLAQSSRSEIFCETNPFHQMSHIHCKLITFVKNENRREMVIG